MVSEIAFMLSRSKYPDLTFSILDNDELNVLERVINWVIKDAGEKNGYELLTEAFLDIDIDNLKLLISFIKDQLENEFEIESVAIPNTIGFILETKEEFFLNEELTIS